MPHGMKQYLEVELFPRMQNKVSKGISVSRWMEKQGFHYTKYKKAMMVMSVQMWSIIIKMCSYQLWLNFEPGWWNTGKLVMMLLKKL